MEKYCELCKISLKGIDEKYTKQCNNCGLKFHIKCFTLWTIRCKSTLDLVLEKNFCSKICAEKWWTQDIFIFKIE